MRYIEAVIFSTADADFYRLVLFRFKICSEITCLPIPYGIIEEGNCYLKPVGYLSVVFRETGITHAKLRLNYGTQLEGWVIMKGNDPEGQHHSWAKLQTRTSPICS